MCLVLLQGKRDECYETRLRIQRVEMNDARHYYLTVENDKGSDSFYVTLTVKGMQHSVVHACHRHSKHQSRAAAPSHSILLGNLLLLTPPCLSFLPFGLFTCYCSSYNIEYSKYLTLCFHIFCPSK